MCQKLIRLLKSVIHPTNNYELEHLHVINSNLQPQPLLNPPYLMKIVNFGVITISDRAFRGEYQDQGGPACVSYLSTELMIKPSYIQTHTIQIHTKTVPDDATQLLTTLYDLADTQDCVLIITTGGTGIAPRDITPQTSLEFIGGYGNVIPGLSEIMRVSSYMKLGVPSSILSRGISGVYKNQCVVVNLPGNPKAVKECLDCVVMVIPHALAQVRGELKGVIGWNQKVVGDNDSHAHSGGSGSETKDRQDH